MIEIKSNFTDWHEVGAEQARRFVEHRMSGMTAIPDDRKAEYIEAHNLRGITVAELLK